MSTGNALKLLAFLAGVALLAWIFMTANMATVVHNLSRLGPAGAVTILAVFAVGFAADVGSWSLLFRTLALSRVWTLRLWLVQMVGEGLNVLAPFGSLGGEPFKALLLKRHYGVSYPEGTASLVLIQTVNSLAEVPFVIVGVALLLERHVLPRPLELAIAGAAAVVTIFMALVIGLLHLRTLAALESRLSRSQWGAKLALLLQAVKEIEEHLFHVVRRTPRRFAGAFAFAFLNWLFGAIEMFLIFHFLGHPIALTDAWLLESTVVLVRSGTFFIPAHLGAQEGTITLLAGALTGSPELGLAAAVVRRGREIVWSAAGLAIGAWFGLRKPVAA